LLWSWCVHAVARTMPLPLLLIDATGPFFRAYVKKRINWSKIPFSNIPEFGGDWQAYWAAIREEFLGFLQEVRALGYTAITLDDLAHLARHPLHEAEVASQIQNLRAEFFRLFELAREQGLKIFLTTDVLPTTPAITAALGDCRRKWDDYYGDLVQQILEDFPQIEGLILRIGESDGLDVKDQIRTRLHVRSAEETNSLLKSLLPHFEKSGKTLILRTWTVGAYRIGDLIWHRGTLERALSGITSPNFVVSMKHGESDFFRYLPLNEAFYRIPHRKIIELQARREYEGAGEYPSFIGWDCERYATELEQVPNLVGMSIWCQTGGWHRFRRRAFLEKDQRDIWIRLNVEVALRIFRDRVSVKEALLERWGQQRGEWIHELLQHAEVVMRDLHYIPDFAGQKLFFRRVRIPPLLHVYWDRLFINHAVRKLMRYFVKDQQGSLQAGEEAYARFPRMIELARLAQLPVDDIEHWRDFCHMLRLARRYYFLPYEESLVEKIQTAKLAYKKAWPSESRQRYRIKISFEPFHVKRQTLGWVATVLLRRQRGYRLLDHLFTLHLLGIVFRLLKPRDPNAMPKFLRKSAMGVDTLFR
jgi:hypothetical protein